MGVQKTISSLLAKRRRDKGLVMTWRTTTASESITLPYDVAGTYSGLIDWGDGTSSVNSYDNRTHTYAVAGNYEVVVKGIVGSFNFYTNISTSKDKIIRVDKLGLLKIENSIFRDCGELLFVENKKIKLPFDIARIFYNCKKLNCELSNFNTNDTFVTASVFQGCHNFNKSVNNWDTSNFTNLLGFFYTCSVYNQPLDNWNVSNVISFLNLFLDCKEFNQPLNSWNTSSCESFFNVFFGCSKFNQPLDNWDSSKVNTMLNMFRGATDFNQDVSMWDYSKVRTINNFMFGKSSANYNATYYDNLLIKWDNAVGGLVFADMTDVNTTMGTIKYTAAGAAARASLVSKGFIITDGGLL